MFFTKSGRKGLRYPGWEIVHVMWYSIFEKWGGTILKLLFGGCFTKLLDLAAQKMENGLSVQRIGKLSAGTLFVIPGCTCVSNMGTLSQTMSQF